jgi:hypothetical protein
LRSLSGEQKGVKKMKKRNFIVGFLFSLATVGTVSALGAPQGGAGGGPGSLFSTILPFFLIIGIPALWIWALIKIVKAYRNRKETPVIIKKNVPQLTIVALGLIYMIAQIIYNFGIVVLLLIGTITLWCIATIKIIRVYLKRKETPVEIRKIIPHASIFALGLIFIIIEIVLLASGPSSASLEKKVLASIRENYEYDATDLKLIKIEKGKYTGMVTVSIYGIPTTLDVDVVTDGRNFQWRINP